MNFADNNILLLLISLAFVYAVLSILVSILVEWFNYLTKERGKHLRNSIHNLITDRENVQLGEEFYNHVTISGLQSLKKRLPDYISSGMFAEAFVDVIAQHNTETDTDISAEKDENNKPVKRMMKRFEDGVQKMPQGQFRDLLQSFIDKSGNDYNQLKSHLENWYNDYMDRVSGWYKLNQRRKLLFAGFLVTLTLNVDSLHLIKVLSLDDNLKNRIVAQAEKTADSYEEIDSSAQANMPEFNRQLMATIDPVSPTTEASPLAKSSGVQRSVNPYAHLQKLMRYTDSLATYNFIKKDSVSRTTVQQLDKGMELLSQLNIPIGWNCNSAPLSWFLSGNDSLQVITFNHASQTPGIIRYLESRNSTPREWNWVLYLIGIGISGVSLSFGAPFWFDILVKLVNIRRAGKVPDVTKK